MDFQDDFVACDSEEGRVVQNVGAPRDLDEGSEDRPVAVDHGMVFADTGERRQLLGGVTN